MSRFLFLCVVMMAAGIALFSASSFGDEAEDARALIFAAGLEAWDEGVRLCDDGQIDDARMQFEQARQRFQQLTDLGVHDANVYFNLGHANMELGRIDEAIHSYRVGQEIEPSDGGIGEALRAARRSTAGQPLLAASPSFRLQVRALLDAVIRDDEYVILGIAGALLWIGIGVRRRWARMGGVFVLGGGGVTALVVVSLMLNAQSIGDPVSVVLSGEGAMIRKSSAFDGLAMIGVPSQPGSEYRIIDQRGDWYSVAVDNDRIGWIHADEVLVVTIPKPGVRRTESAD